MCGFKHNTLTIREGDIVKATDRKAVRLVVENRVTVTTATFDTDGAVTTAAGTVRGDTGTYLVAISPEGVDCSCTYGQTRHTSHSHDQALRLAAQHQKENL